MKKASLFALLLGTMLVSGHAAIAQQSDDTSQDNEAAPTASSAADEAVSDNDDAAAVASGREDRFFLGARPQLRRQIGPVLAKPRSILPQPFVPLGSVTMPDPAATELATDDPQASALEAEAGGEQPDTAQDTGLEMGDTDAENMDPTGFLAEAALETIDPSGLSAIGDDSGFPADFWGQITRADMIAVLNSFAQPTRFMPMRDVARRVALSPVNLPAPATGSDVTAFMAARLAVLAAHGDQAGYLALLARLPRDYDWSEIARLQADGQLIAGRIEDACALAAAERADSNDPYWLRLAAFCRAVAADRVGVDFQLGILEELSDIQPTFYQLIDQILVEAEQGANAVLTNGLTLTTPLRVDVLEATMARLAKVQVPVLALDTVNPLAAGTLLAVPGVADAAKLQLMTAGLEGGWLGAETVSAYLAIAPAEDRTAEDVLMQADVDDHFEVDLALLQLAAASDTREERDPVLTVLWERATRLGRAPLIGPAARSLLAAQVPTDPVVSGLAFRGILLARDTVQLNAASTALRAGRVGDDPVKDATLLDAWPLIATATARGGPAVTDAGLVRWWQAQAGAETGAADAALLFTTLEALGHSVPDELWRVVEEGAVAVDAGWTVSPALWRRLLLAAAKEDKGRVLALAYRMTQQGQVSDAFTSSLVAALAGAGLEREARQVATHMLVGRGL